MKSFIVLLLWTLSTMQFVTNEAAFAVVKWNKRTGEFEPIPGLPSHDTVLEDRALRSRQEKTHDFNGQPLHFTYYEELGFVHFTENDTKVSGIYGDLWTILSQMLNFTLVVRRSKAESLGNYFENGTYTGIIHDTRINRTDIIPKLEAVKERLGSVRFTLPFWRNRYRIYAYGLWQRDRAWIFKQFTPQVWCLVLVFIVILSVGSLSMHRVSTRYKVSARQKSFLDHLFDTFATVCNQSNILDSMSNGVRILTITVSIFSWLIMISYSACFIYSMAHEEFTVPYTDLVTLFENTKFSLVVTNGSLGHVVFLHAVDDSIFNRIKKANRVTVVSTIEELVEKVCLDSRNYVLTDGEHEVKVRSTLACNLIPTDTIGAGVPIASGISERVLHKRSIDIGILKLREYGITEVIKNRYFTMTENEATVRQTDSLAIDLDQFSLILLILAIGIVASSIICVAENIFALKKHKSNTFLSQRLLGSEQPLFDRTRPTGSCIPCIERSENLYFTELNNNLARRPRISWRTLIRDY